ncbi:MAG: hypothetical protein FJ246_07420 [Nitrospira sp.]|nr:hypothetical protein [Nitrospira sp.]
MGTHFIRSMVLVAALALTTGCAELSSQDAGSTGSAVATNGHARVAAGAVEDSLKACLARIPGNASSGQRMVAEQSCQRDQGDRK